MFCRHGLNDRRCEFGLPNAMGQLSLVAGPGAIQSQAYRNQAA